MSAISIRRQPLLIPMLVVAVAIATWTWQANAAGDSDPSSIVTIDPIRIVDTRDGTDLGLTGPVTNGASQTVQITGAIPTLDGTETVVPNGATGVLLNATVVGPTGGGFLSIRPGTATGVAETSNLNFVAGQTVPNAVTVALPTSGADRGTIDVQHGGPVPGSTTDLLLDVVGYIVATPAAGGVQLVSVDQTSDGAIDDEATETIVTLQFDAPSAGQLLVTGTATVSDMEPDAFLNCGVSDDGSNPGTTNWESAGMLGSIGTVATTALFDVEAGSTTIELVCTSFRADDGNRALVSSGRLSAVFTPS